MNAISIRAGGPEGLGELDGCGGAHCVCALAEGWLEASKVQVAGWGSRAGGREEKVEAGQVAWRAGGLCAAAKSEIVIRPNKFSS